MKESLQLAPVMREKWWKARGEEMRFVLVSQGGFNGKALDLKPGNRQRYTGGFKLQK